MRPAMKPAWEEMDASAHRRAANPVPDRVARVFRHIELNGPTSLALDDGDTLSDTFANYEIRDFQANKVTTAQLAIDGQVEQRQIPEVSNELKPGTNGPNLLWEQRTFLPDQSTLVPWTALRPDGG